MNQIAAVDDDCPIGAVIGEIVEPTRAEPATA
jgi:hypothetical protein